MKYTALNWPAARWPSFSHKEMRCSHCGECEVDPQMMDELQEVRDTVGFPLKITSGYRCPQHPVEAAKEAPGSHTYGKAVDIAVDRGKAFAVLQAALVAFTGIGIKQHGGGRFLHLDTMENGGRWFRKTIWSYK